MVNHSVLYRSIQYVYMNILTWTILKKTQILNGCETFAFKYKYFACKSLANREDFLKLFLLNCQLGGYPVRILILIFIWLQAECQLGSIFKAYNLRKQSGSRHFSISHIFIYNKSPSWTPSWIY